MLRYPSMVWQLPHRFSKTVAPVRGSASGGVSAGFSVCRNVATAWASSSFPGQGGMGPRMIPTRSTSPAVNARSQSFTRPAKPM
jgi:hypothetical protein